MTKMTLLHFASPFAFSMPMPVRVTQENHGGAAGSAVTEASSEAPKALTSNASAIGSATPTASDGEGFEADRFDAVLRRYREQDGAVSDGAEDGAA